jgi:broad specificity phosphatase PhoE
VSHVFFLRHADRDGAPGFDDPINDTGRARAYGIEWDCDLAIVSPLRRTNQTLEASRIRYRYKIQSGLCRECLDGYSQNYLPGEALRQETAEELNQRVEAFRDFLLSMRKAFSSILVVTHGVFMSRFLKSESGIGYCEYRRWDP